MPCEQKISPCCVRSWRMSSTTKSTVMPILVAQSTHSECSFEMER
jgi:hypothetical protein